MRDEYDFSKAKRGVVVPTTDKTRITIRIDDDVLEWFRKQVYETGGGSYQAMMNHALRESMEQQVEPLEETLRRVILEVVIGAVSLTFGVCPSTQGRSIRRRRVRWLMVREPQWCSQ